MKKYILIAVFLFGISIPCYAQFIGIRIGIPGMSVYGVGAGHGGGGGVSSGLLQDNISQYLQDDVGDYLQAG
jgi:hypothetical protein